MPCNQYLNRSIVFLQCNVLNACWIIRSFVPQIIKKTICHNVLSLLPWSKWDTLKTSSKLYIGNTSPWWKKWKLFLSFSRKEIAIWEVRSFQKFKWLHYLKHFHSIEPKVNISNKTRTPEIFCSSVVVSVKIIHSSQQCESQGKMKSSWQLFQEQNLHAVSCGIIVLMVVNTGWWWTRRWRIGNLNVVPTQPAWSFHRCWVFSVHF